MIESEDKNENPDDDPISLTVFYHAKKSGCDDDEAERVAKSMGTLRYNSTPAKCKRWIYARIKAIAATISTVIGSAGLLWLDEITIIIKDFFL